MKLRPWRWWHWLGVSVLVLVLAAFTALFSLHAWAAKQLETIESRLRAEGRPTRYQEIMATAPSRDPIQHAAWVAIEGRWQKAATGIEQHAATTWLAAGAPAPAPATVAAWLAANVTLMDETTATLEHGGLGLGSWPDPALFAPGLHPSFGTLPPTWTPNIAAVRAYAIALAARACAGNDDGRLADLDAFVASFSSNCLIDIITVRSVASIRDQARLLLLLRHAGDPGMAAWIASPPVVLAGGRVAMRGERLLGSGIFADSASAPGLFSRNGGFYWWIIGTADAAAMVTAMACIESRLNGVSTLAPPIPSWAIITRIAMPNIGESCQVLIEAEAQERAARVAAELLCDWRAGHAPPTDQTDLPESCRARLMPSAGTATLRYVRTAEGFVIDIDPAAGLPPGMGRAAKPLTSSAVLTLGAGVAVGGPPVP